jgi:hypothetical protein
MIKKFFLLLAMVWGVLPCAFSQGYGSQGSTDLPTLSGSSSPASVCMGRIDGSGYGAVMYSNGNFGGENNPCAYFQQPASTQMAGSCDNQEENAPTVAAILAYVPDPTNTCSKPPPPIVDCGGGVYAFPTATAAQFAQIQAANPAGSVVLGACPPPPPPPLFNGYAFSYKGGFSVFYFCGLANGTPPTNNNGGTGITSVFACPCPSGRSVGNAQYITASALPAFMQPAITQIGGLSKITSALSYVCQ